MEADHNRLTKKILPEAVKIGAFGADVKNVVCFKPRNQNIGNHYSSGILLGDVTLEKTTGEHFVEPIVIKANIQSCSLHEWSFVDFNGCFFNEVLFYTKVVPLLRKYDKSNVLTTSFPELLYGKSTNGENLEDDLIILKDLGRKGFRLTEHPMFLDEKHVKLALDRLAKFHCLSLECQMDNPNEFNEVVAQIKGLIVPSVQKGSFFKEFSQIYNRSLLRGIKPLENDPKYRDNLSDLLAYIERAADTEWVGMKYKKPLGSLTVLAHGDFHRNNLLFKYGDNGDPVEVVFIDMAQIKLCSPGVDSSQLFAVHVSPQVRSSYWEDFLRTYYDSMSLQLEGHPKKPSFETVELDWRQTGIYGYHIAAYFVPLLVEVIYSTSSETPNTDKTQEKEGFQNLIQTMKEKGGQKATEYLVEIVKHMLDKKYIFLT